MTSTTLATPRVVHIRYTRRQAARRKKLNTALYLSFLLLAVIGWAIASSLTLATGEYNWL